MSERRKALIAKFRATATDRIRRMSLSLIDLEEGRGGASDLRDVARELHTLKGESNMLGMAPLGAVAHAAETALKSAGGGVPDANACALVRRGLGVIERALDEDPPGADPVGALAAMAAELAAIAAPRTDDAAAPPGSPPDTAQRAAEPAAASG